MIAPSGKQITIVAEDQQAVVVEVGGGVRSYSVGGRANGDDGGAAISDARQRCPGAPDNGRRSKHALLKRTTSLRSTDHAGKSRIGIEFRVLHRTPCSVWVAND